METKSNILPSAIFGLCFILGLAIFGNYFYKSKSADDSIAVTGSAKKQITSDVAKWSANFSRSSGLEGLKSANNLLAKDTENFKKFLLNNDISLDKVKFYPVNIVQTYNYVDNQSIFSGYSLTESFEISLSDVDKITKLSEKASELINQDVALNNSSVSYYYSKLADLRVEMLGQATKDAQIRAQKIAENTGMKIGNLKSASMGVMQITAPNSTDLSAEGYYDVSSVEKEITAIVRANFSLR